MHLSSQLENIYVLIFDILWSLKLVRGLYFYLYCYELLTIGNISGIQSSHSPIIL